jgi:hypothetical protein
MATIEELKARLPLPDLLRAMGLGDYAKKLCCSPLRKDNNPSWGIYQDDKGWHWKDFATGEGGDELDFLKALHNCDTKEALTHYENMAGLPKPAQPTTVSIGKLPDPGEWHQAVESLAGNPKTLAHLATWRGYSKTLLVGLIENGLAGLVGEAIAFPIYNEGGAYQGMHLRTESGWRITGGGNQPWLIGSHDADNLHVFESQWDAMAFMDSQGYGNGAWQPETHACMITRGASNARKLEGRLHPDQKVYIWPQNDDAGAKWAKQVAEMATGDVFKVKVPDDINDTNDWLKRDGKSALKSGLALARRMPKVKAEETADEVPAGLIIKRYSDLQTTPMVVPQQVIDGVLYRGGKMIVGGTSKGRKTWSLMDLAAAVATGSEFWGRQCNLGDVLYINFELQEFNFRQRMEAILKARNCKDASRVHVLNLRGQAADMTVLRPILAQAIESRDFSLLIFDPIYKLIGSRSENDAGDMADLMNEFEALAVDSGSGMVFAHHFAKGAQGGKFAIDRMSGSGVLSRDPDAILILSDHEEDDCYVCEATLRCFPAIPPFALRWDFPQLKPCDDLDVEGIRQPGRKKTYNENQLLDLLPSDGLTFGDWLEKAKAEHGISKTSFFRSLKKLKDADTVFKQEGGIWMPFGQFRT